MAWRLNVRVGDNPTGEGSTRSDRSSVYIPIRSKNYDRVYTDPAGQSKKELPFCTWLNSVSGLGETDGLTLRS
jgi:hypothetical protein